MTGFPENLDDFDFALTPDEVSAKCGGRPPTIVPSIVAPEARDATVGLVPP
jgi:hypothetical protein